jgi:hypothetical protein
VNFDAETLLRAGAVVAAAALLAQPYYGQIRWAVAQAAEAARAHASGITRLAAAGLIVAAAWGKVPLPTLPQTVPAVVVPEPSAELARLVEPVAKALGTLPAADRAVWASVWSKAALVVEAEGGTSVAAFADTPALRSLTVVALDVAWRRIQGHAPGSITGLRQAVETAMRSVLGLDSTPATPDVRRRYAEVCRAIAWAGTR